MENLLKDTKSLQDTICSESFKRMPFVSFFLYLLMAFFLLSTFAEFWITFGLHDVNWINYNPDQFYKEEHYRSYYFGFTYVELIIGILSVINAIAMILILKSRIKGFWVIACSCTIALFILALYSQYFNIKYNSVGNLILLKNLFIPFILWAVLNLKNDKGESQWQYLN